MKAKPIVGLMPLWDEGRESIWMLPGYMKGIEKAGGIPIILPLSDNEEVIEKMVNFCDGFLFTGGQDVSPEIYNEKKLDNVECSEERDRMDMSFLRKAIELDKPVLGICRGIQIINACLGGSLYQDLPTQHPSELEHHQTPPYDIPVHEVKIIENTPLSECLKTEKLSVNSYHHQAVKKLAPELAVMAEASDGITEAVYRPASSFLWALQWHPEFSYKTDEKSMLIFQAFVDAMIDFDK